MCARYVRHMLSHIKCICHWAGCVLCDGRQHPAHCAADTLQERYADEMLCMTPTPVLRQKPVACAYWWLAIFKHSQDPVTTCTAYTIHHLICLCKHVPNPVHTTLLCRHSWDTSSLTSTCPRIWTHLQSWSRSCLMSICTSTGMLALNLSHAFSLTTQLELNPTCWRNVQCAQNHNAVCSSNQ